MRAARLLGCLVLAGCPNAVRAVEAPPPVVAKDEAPGPLPPGQVVLTDAFGRTHRVGVEIASTAKSRAYGLMNRSSLADGKGMLFIFPTESVQSFWMKNTLIPLDMIFISQDLRVVGIVTRAEPKTLTSRAVAAPSKYVLEVPGGWSELKGITVGSRVQLSGVSQINVEP